MVPARARKLAQFIRVEFRPAGEDVHPGPRAARTTRRGPFMFHPRLDPAWVDPPRPVADDGPAAGPQGSTTA